MDTLVTNLQYLSNHKSAIPHTLWSEDAVKLHDLLIKGYSPITEPKLKSILNRLNKVFSDHNLPRVDVESNLIAECRSFALHNGIRRCL